MKFPLMAAASLTFALLCACSRDAATAATPTTTPAPAASTPPAQGEAYTDAQHGFSVTVPADMSLRHDFQRSYLGDGAWKAFAPPGSQGSPVFALVLQGSNRITAAELRLGVSSDADAVAHCLDAPEGVSDGKATTEQRNGVTYTRFHAGDAAMNHYLEVEAYRTVRKQRCYAIDLLITGTNPQVYDPPATPPFDRVAAQQKLRDAFAGFRLLD